MGELLAEIEQALERGERPADGELVRALRSAACPASLVERLAGCRWVLRAGRVLPLLLRHPACPRPFALEAMLSLGWRDLLAVAREPRAAPPVRRQAELKLKERVAQLTSGERTALARQATRSVLVQLLDSADPLCVRAMLDNPQFTETEALRLLTANRHADCLVEVVRHREWGQRPAVVRSAVRSRRMPLGVVLGMLATLTVTELEQIADAPEVAAEVRDAAARLAERRRPEADG
jgi:hypothetical protein